MAVSCVRLTTFPIDVFHVQKILCAAPYVTAVIASVRPRRPVLNVQHWIESYHQTLYELNGFRNNFGFSTLGEFRQATVSHCSLDGSKFHVEGAAVVPSVHPSCLLYMRMIFIKYVTFSAHCNEGEE